MPIFSIYQPNLVLKVLCGGVLVNCGDRHGVSGRNGFFLDLTSKLDE